MKCSFCNKTIKIDRAYIYFYSNGNSLVFCSSKCRKLMLKLNRDPKKLKWVSKSG